MAKLLRKALAFAGTTWVFALSGIATASHAQQEVARASHPNASRTTRTVWKISFQLGYDRSAPAFARYAPVGKLPYARAAAMTKYVLDRIVGVVVPETHATKVQLMYGPGGYKHFPLSPSAQLDVLGTHEEVVTLEEAIGYLAHQNEVIASRIRPSGRKPAFQIVQRQGQKLLDPALLQRFWNRIGEQSPQLQQGFLPLILHCQPGIRIINTETAWTDTDYPDFEHTVSTLAHVFDIPLVTQRLRVDFESTVNAWKTHPDGSDYLDRLRTRGHAGLADRLVHKYRPIVNRWLLAGLERYGARQPRKVSVRRAVETAGDSGDTTRRRN